MRVRLLALCLAAMLLAAVAAPASMGGYMKKAPAGYMK